MNRRSFFKTIAALFAVGVTGAVASDSKVSKQKIAPLSAADFDGDVENIILSPNTYSAETPILDPFDSKWVSVSDARKLRTRYKKLAFTSKEAGLNDYFEKYNNIQADIKFQINRHYYNVNSFYGAYGTKETRLYDPSLHESLTSLTKHTNALAAIKNTSTVL